ncbi:STAS domain-containing protein [Streptomyces sp. NPDC003038]|uniref:STAS domain-containing protein n=1 Tax=unclassified Streptomyces TaxID=2593676 RepID=UPI0033AF4815
MSPIPDLTPDKPAGRAAPEPQTAQDDTRMRTSVSQAPGCPTKVVVAGEIDFNTSAEAFQVMASALSAYRRGLEVDLSQVTFCDCSGLNALLRARLLALKGARSFRITDASPPVERLLTLTGTRTLLTGGGPADAGPRTCALCGEPASADRGAVVPDSSYIDSRDHRRDGKRPVAACSEDHLRQLLSHYGGRPFTEAELWAGRVARTINIETLAAESGLDEKQLAAAALWRRHGHIAPPEDDLRAP